ncbi:MAG: tRNA uridine-5-carboxymethylaminomethyl(34) synthesis GTPase MnmE, partial [Myxococcota bacterium]
MSAHDTIAALATPPGRGGVGILRVSGPGAEAILGTLAPAWPRDTPSHLMKLARIQDADARPIDEALVVVMRAGRSYTGEDVVEVHCHGGPIILRRALDAALQAGARIARPGEFTERAFLNGRLDLTQAEAVADLIDA